MTQVDHSIFRKYDIRGVAVGDNPQITPELARLVGKALGTYMPKEFNTERVFVGSDNRVTSEPIRNAMIEGLLSTGMNVTDIGDKCGITRIDRRTCCCQFVSGDWSTVIG